MVEDIKTEEDNIKKEDTIKKEDNIKTDVLSRRIIVVVATIAILAGMVYVLSSTGHSNSSDNSVTTPIYTNGPTPTQTPTLPISTSSVSSTIAFIADAKPALGKSIDKLKSDFDQIIPQSPGKVNAVVMIGDMNPIASGSSNTNAAYAASTAKDIPAFYVIGNHELNNKDDLPADRSKFDSYAYSPKPGPTGSRETTYSFDIGDIHVVVLNEYWDGDANGVCDWHIPSKGLNADDSCFKYDSGNGGFIPDELYNWLEKDLNDNTKKWTIVVGHEPLYPWGGHIGDSLDQNIANRDKLENLFISKKVTAFIGGHTHHAGVRTIDDIFHANAGVMGDNVGNGDNFATIIYTYIDSTGNFVLEQKYENPTWDSTGLNKSSKNR